MYARCCNPAVGHQKTDHLKRIRSGQVVCLKSIAQGKRLRVGRAQKNGDRLIPLECIVGFRKGPARCDLQLLIRLHIETDLHRR